MNTNRGLMVAAVVIVILAAGWFYVRMHTAPSAVVPDETASSTGTAPGTNAYEITSADRDKTYTYPLTSRFTVILDGTKYPPGELACAPAGILGPISNIPAVQAPLFAARFEAAAAGTCTLSDRDFHVTIRVTGDSGEGSVTAPAEAVVRGYYDALNDKDGAAAHAYLSKAFAAQLAASQLQMAADSLASITVVRTSPQSQSDTQAVYETVLRVATKAGGLTSFSAGENIRFVELVKENGSWKIAKITTSPQ